MATITSVIINFDDGSSVNINDIPSLNASGNPVASVAPSVPVVEAAPVAGDASNTTENVDSTDISTQEVLAEPESQPAQPDQSAPASPVTE